ncbi:putative salicylate hydroxylase [Cryphonectria parasitica EP155]|uniref:Salicylate hydroxylase n=1 Tax=Cryphonectria parasitica (strain ATCC 38755 / EP155) TaxID=660469 RepID=A0A9P4Y464_CRYP1|nr:putative salicylate hydroxylase [Cryphonectria parasitica EP155]KAF3766612.1 putative salicylate hydroxylase [Cryphonectria parasitica EP155]
MTSDATSRNKTQLTVAIVGGGITGLSLAVGLLYRNVNVTIYERASGIREIGAGIGFTPNAERAMKILEPRVLQHFRQIAVQNGDDWFRYVNGLSSGNGEGSRQHQDVMFKIHLGERGFEGCRRSDFVKGLVDMLPPEMIKFGRDLASLKDEPVGAGKVRLCFRDGSVADADVGQYEASYTHKFAFRGLVPMDIARATLGEDKTTTRIMYLGPDAHTLTFPVADGKILNVVSFVTDPEPWDSGADGERFVKPAHRDEAIQAFSGFTSDVRNLMSLLPKDLEKWAIFDMYENPVPTYSTGHVCLAGDAAHASSPHHGAGAGCGIEDALLLAEILAMSASRSVGRDSTSGGIVGALAVYNDARYQRSQWIVQTSRQVGEMYEWQHPEIGRDKEKFGKDFEWRCRTIWNFDIDRMVASALEMLDNKLERLSIS